MVWEGLIVTAFGAVLTVTGYGAKKVLDLDKKQAAHEASDLATFQALAKDMRETKEGVSSGNDKLDRLVMHMLENPTGPATKKRTKR